MDHPPECQEILLSGILHPDGDVSTQDVLYSASIEVPEHPEWGFKVQQPSEMVETLVGFLYQGVYVVLSDVNTKVF